MVVFSFFVVTYSVASVFIFIRCVFVFVVNGVVVVALQSEMLETHYIGLPEGFPKRVRDLCEVEFFWEVFLEGKGTRAY